MVVGHVKVKASRQTSSGPMSGGVAQGRRVPVKSGQCLLCRQMGHFARDCPNRGSRDDSHSHLQRAVGSFVGMVHGQSTIRITKPGTPRVQVNVDGESSSILFSLDLISQFCSSWCPRRRANPVLESCTISTENSQQTRLHNVCLSLTACSSTRSFM